MILPLVICILLFHDAIGTVDPIIGEDPKGSPQESIPGLTFGDMMLTDEQKLALKRGENMGGSKNVFGAVKGNNLRWTNAIVPYELDCSVEHLNDATQAIFAAMAEWESKTCIRFVKRTTEKYFVKFFRNTGCWAHVGMTSYSKVSVGYGCEYQHVMTHEIGHVVGFYHEQNRKDRDDYVTVHWGNIGQFKSQFRIVENTDSLGVPYDYASIMHYPWNAFSANGQDTMSPKKPLNGKRPYIALSDDDAKQTSLMYNCPVIEKKRKSQTIQSKSLVGEIFDKRDVSDGCADKSKYCAEWARNGHCSTNPLVMSSCQMTCGAPSCLESHCQDLHQKCAMWKSWGHCKISTYVQKYCKKSCDPKCPVSTKPPKPDTKPPTDAPSTKSPTDAPITKGPTTKAPVQTTKSGCKDLNTKCQLWKSWGHCKISPYVQKHCPKSCDPACGGAVPTTQSPQPDTRPPTNAMTKNPHTDAPNTKPSTYVPMTKGGTDAPTTITSPQPTSKPGTKFLGTGILCMDNYRECVKLAQQGRCKTDPWMLRNCKLSCKSTDCDPKGLKPPGACANPLGLSWDGTSKLKIPNSAMYSPVYLAPGAGWGAYAENARLYFQDDYRNRRIGAWCAPSHDSAKSGDGYVQVDLGQQKNITHIATQGRHKYFERVSQFKIQFSDNGRYFRTYKEDGNDKIFDGNCDHRTPVLNKFNNQITARYIRYLPWNWNYPCVRMELYGC